MGLLNVIRTLRLQHGLAIREIVRRTGLSRNTIKKHLKAGTVEPQFSTPERHPIDLLRAYQAEAETVPGCTMLFSLALKVVPEAFGQRVAFMHAPIAINGVWVFWLVGAIFQVKD